MVSDREVHGAAEIGAAQHGIAVHSIGGQVDAGADRESEMRVARQRDRISIALDQLVRGNASCRYIQIRETKVSICQRIGGRGAVQRQLIDRGRYFCR